MNIFFHALVLRIESSSLSLSSSPHLIHKSKIKLHICSCVTAHQSPLTTHTSRVHETRRYTIQVKTILIKIAFISISQSHGNYSIFIQNYVGRIIFCVNFASCLASTVVQLNKFQFSFNEWMNDEYLCIETPDFPSDK